MNVLTLDLGTSSTKATLWADDRRVALARAVINTRHPSADRAEQDPEDWWRSVAASCSELRDREPDLYAAVDAVGCSAARETFARFDKKLRPLSPGLVWSDARAVDEARELGDPNEFRRRTGVKLGPSCCAAKIAWLRRHEGASFREAAWLLSPRDFVLGRVTGQVATDPTLASRTGVYDLTGAFVGDEDLLEKLPPVTSSIEMHAVNGSRALALPDKAVVILGAGDRACEVLGAGATSEEPMVSWGTTANLSIPHPGPVGELPQHAQVSCAALGGFLVEAGLSIAGAALDWLAALTGWTKEELLSAAAEVPPGARGLLAYPWLYGARAPWWRSEVRGAFVGLAPVHGPPELARSVIEGVALDVARCIDLLHPKAEMLALAGRGADEHVWRSVLLGVTGRVLRRRRSAEVASVGARLLVAEGFDDPTGLDDVNPIVHTHTPEPVLVDAYRTVREQSDRVASRLINSP